jgi:hypothetical protein
MRWQQSGPGVRTGPLSLQKGGEMIPTYVIAYVIGDNGKDITYLDGGLSSANENGTKRRSSDSQEFHDEKEKELSPSPELFAEIPVLDPFFDWS